MIHDLKMLSVPTGHQNHRWKSPTQYCVAVTQSFLLAQIFSLGVELIS
uniref:Uncharacterized protein n=1 Tax=Anguilla anguilla TaxID=7936 RepID=A0A0E9SKP7_ANGAN